MTKENFTSINVVIDRSGSMAPLTKDTIGGFNTFLKEQKAVPGDAVLTLATFSDHYTLVHDCVPIANVEELSSKTYVTGGGTALLDAIGKTIHATGAKLSAMKEEDRPSKVIFLVMTDGEENMSKEFIRAKIMEMINHQRDTYSWEFVFIGANQDAIMAGHSLGIAATHSHNYSSNSIGTRAAYSSMSSGMDSYRRAKVGAVFNMQDPNEVAKKLEKQMADIKEADLKTKAGIGPVVDATKSMDAVDTKVKMKNDDSNEGHESVTIKRN